MAHEAHSTHVASRRIGEADVTIISEGSCRWAPRFQAPEAEWRSAMPEADADGRIPIGFNLAHVRCGGASIVIDPGFDDPLSAWQQGFAAHSPSLADIARTPGLASALASLDVAPDGVTHVLITHSHADHFAGIMAERDGGAPRPISAHPAHPRPGGMGDQSQAGGAGLGLRGAARSDPPLGVARPDR